MLIGIAVVLIVAIKLLPVVENLLNPAALAKLLTKDRILVIVGKALAYSAAIDLAYMLFTPGPDEAVEPLMLGAAAAALMWIPSPGPNVTTTSLFSEVGIVAIFVILLGLLFAIRREFIQEDSRQPFGRLSRRALRYIANRIAHVSRRSPQW